MATRVVHVHTVGGIGKKDLDVVRILRIVILALDELSLVPIKIEIAVSLAPLGFPVFGPAADLRRIGIVSITELDLALICLEGDPVVVRKALSATGKDDDLFLGKEGGGKVSQRIVPIEPNNVCHTARGIEDDHDIRGNACGDERRRFADILSQNGDA